MTNKVIGIDPGKKGAVAIISWSLSGHALAIDVHAMPGSAIEFHDLLWPHSHVPASAHIYLEKAQAMPKNGAVSMFNYGVHFGELLGVISSLGFPHTLVPPSTWTKTMHVGCTKTDPKARSLQAVRRLFPGEKLTFGDRAKKPHDGLVDALLIADYGRRDLNGR